MTDTRITTTTSPVDSHVIVSADQDTIIGDGTIFNPLRVGSALNGFRFHAIVSNNPPSPGFFVSAAPVLAGATRVTPGDARAVGGPGKQICGVVIEIIDGAADVLVQSGGLITLTTEEWDNVTEGSGGLSAGSPYYLVTFPGHTPGNAITTPPPGANEFVVFVGVALSPTTMLTTSIPSVIFRNPP